jgi:hypothetical protein
VDPSYIVQNTPSDQQSVKAAENERLTRCKRNELMNQGCCLTMVKHDRSPCSPGRLVNLSLLFQSNPMSSPKVINFAKIAAVTTLY